MIFPDGTSYTRFQSTVKRYNLKHLIINKNRTDAGESNIEYYQGVSPDGLVAVIFDDMIDSGGTTIEAGEEAYRLGAREVLSYATHFIASAKVIRDKETKEFKRVEFTEDKFSKSQIKVVASDTIPRTLEYRKAHKDWFTQFTIAPYLGDLIYCNVSGLPHNEFIKDYAAIAEKGLKKDIRNEIERFFIY
jgi:phosphoribosylpyrophosphate synthetase